MPTTPKRQYFPDEEPEDENPWLDYSGVCQYCGQPRHGKGVRCPNRPVIGPGS